MVLMKELTGYGGRTFYAIQVSRNRILTLTPHPRAAGVVSGQHLRPEGWDRPCLVMLRNVGPFVAELWRIG